MDPATKWRINNRAQFYRRGGLAATFGAWVIFGVYLLLAQYASRPGIEGWILAVVVVFLLVEAVYNFAIWIVLLPEKRSREVFS